MRAANMHSAHLANTGGCRSREKKGLLEKRCCARRWRLDKLVWISWTDWIDYAGLKWIHGWDWVGLVVFDLDCIGLTGLTGLLDWIWWTDGSNGLE